VKGTAQQIQNLPNGRSIKYSKFLFRNCNSTFTPVIITNRSFFSSITFKGIFWSNEILKTWNSCPQFFEFENIKILSSALNKGNKPFKGYKFTEKLKLIFRRSKSTTKNFTHNTFIYFLNPNLWLESPWPYFLPPACCAFLPIIPKLLRLITRSSSVVLSPEHLCMGVQIPMLRFDISHVAFRCFNKLKMFLQRVSICLWSFIHSHATYYVQSVTRAISLPSNSLTIGVLWGHFQPNGDVMCFYIIKNE
jgi:hypothetical protein